MSWAEISQEMHEYKFTHLHLAEDRTSTMNALGSLCNGEGTWPLLTNGRIDMQFARFEMFSPQTKVSCDGNKDGDYSPAKLCSLRPAAERLKTELEKKNSTCTAHVLLAGPGLGKTSALADLGRQSWIIYMRATRPSDYGHFWEPTPRNCDSSFLRLNNELEKDRFEAKAKEELYADWSMVVHRFTAEMVARVLHLVRLHRHCSENNRTLTPWDFTFQQIKGGQTFPSNMSRILKSVDEQSLMKILEEAMAELKPIMGDRKLIVAIDNVSGAREMLTGWFQRPVDSQQAASDAQTDCSLSILAPLCEVVSKLSVLTGWHLVLAGDEPSNQFIRGLKVDLGKIELKTVIANASDFPLASAEQVIAILEQLNISEELKDALKVLVTDESREGLSQPTLVQGDSLVRDIVQLLKDYVVGARFGILCGAIEQISKFVGKGIRDEILMCALQQSLEDHRRSLIWTLSSRLDCKSHANYLGSRELEHVYLRNMVQISVAVGLTNGKVRIVKNPDIPSLGSDLVRLGLAPFSLASPCDTNIECDDPPIKYIVSERFAIEALDRFLKYEIIQRGCHGALEYFEMFQGFKQWVGSWTEEEEGNVVEQMILKHLFDLAGCNYKVMDLFEESDPLWDGYPLKSLLNIPVPSSTLMQSSSKSEDDPLNTSLQSSSSEEDPIKTSKQSTSPTESASGEVFKSEELEPRALSLSVSLQAQLGTRLQNRKTPSSAAVSQKMCHKPRMKRLALEREVGNPPTLHVQVVLPSRSENLAEPVEVHMNRRDLRVTIDKSNLRQFLKSPSNDDEFERAYKLLRFATGSTEGWSGEEPA